MQSLEYCKWSCEGIYLFTNSLHNNQHTFTGHTKKIFAAEFNSDGSKVVTGSHDRTIKIWGMNKGTCFKTILCQSSVNDLDICKITDLCVSGHFDATLRFWDLRQMQMVESIKNAHSQQITSVTFSSKGNEVMTASRDNVIKVFDVRTYKELVSYK